MKLVLDAEILREIKEDGSDLRIIQDDSEVNYKLNLVQGNNLAHQSVISSTSSIRDAYQESNFNAGNMIDGDYGKTFFEIDSLIDPESAWFVLDLKEKKVTNRIKIWSPNRDYTWTTIQIEGSNDLSDWNLIKKSTDFSFQPIRQIIYPISEFRFLKFQFKHTQSLRINEIEIFGATSGSLIFFANSNKKSRIYYGRFDASVPDYDISELYTSIATQLVITGSQKANLGYDNDKDKDGIPNQIDNCILIRNEDQKNSDRR